MRAFLAAAAVLTVACRAVPLPTDPPSTHPGSALATESAVPTLRGPATTAITEPKSATAPAPMPGMGGGRR